LNEKLPLPTHPEGLYCVIDQFLSTYSDGNEYSDDENDDDAVDNIDNTDSDKKNISSEYSLVYAEVHKSLKREKELASQNNFDFCLETNITDAKITHLPFYENLPNFTNCTNLKLYELNPYEVENIYHYLEESVVI